MPLYVADYLADTAHLSTTEHGAYLLLIMHYWTKCSLPADEEAIRRITRMTPRQWSHSRDVLRSLFSTDWTHKRIDSELAKSLEKSRVNSANAQRSHDNRTANAQRTQVRSHTQSQSQSEREEKKEDIRVVAMATHPANEKFEEFWKAKPRRAGADPKTPAEKLFLAAVKAGTPADEIIAGAKRWAINDAGKVGTEYLPQAVKWLRDKRWLDYAEDGPVVSAETDWDWWLGRFARNNSHWSFKLGPEPGMPGCRVPLDILTKYGLAFQPKQQAAE